MVYFAFSHNFGNGMKMKQWHVKDRSPRWYLTRTEFKNGEVRIVASCGDNGYKNDLKSIKEAHIFIDKCLETGVY